MSVQHANSGIVKKDLQLYYNRDFVKSFRGEATTNIAYATNNFLNSNGNWWVNSGSTVFSDNDTSIDKPIILNVDTTNLRIFSSTVTAVGNQQLGSSIIPISGSTQYSMSIYYWFSGTSMQSQPYVRTNVNNNSLVNFGYNGDTNYLNWPRRTWIRLTATFTTPANETGVYMSSYTGDTAGEKLAYFGYQIEQKAYVTPLVLGSRSANTVVGGGGLLDISGNNLNSDLTNVAFNVNGYIFSGSQYINVPYSSNLDRNDFTISGYFRTPTNDNSHDTIISRNSDVYGTTNGWNISRLRNGLSLANCFRVMIYGDSSLATEPQGPVISDNVWRYFAVVVDKSGSNTVTIYINGVAYSIPATLPSGNHYPSSGSPPLYIGCNKTNADLWNGDISQITFHSRVLTAAEILQNFNSTRKIYGI